MKTMFYLLLVFIIGLVSVYDNVLNVLYSSTLYAQEQNPVAKSIIEHCGVEGLVYFKAAGTIIATLICVGLVYSKYKKILVLLLLGQITLFCYLTFSGGSSQKSLTFTATPAEDFMSFYVGEFEIEYADSRPNPLVGNHEDPSD